MDIEEIKKKDYLNANDLMKIIPNLKYDRARKLINDAQKEMEEKKYFIPIVRPKVALTKIIKKRLGF